MSKTNFLKSDPEKLILTIALFVRELIKKQLEFDNYPSVDEATDIFFQELLSSIKDKPNKYNSSSLKYEDLDQDLSLWLNDQPTEHSGLNTDFDIRLINLICLHSGLYEKIWEASLEEWSKSKASELLAIDSMFWGAFEERNNAAYKSMRFTESKFTGCKIGFLNVSDEKGPLECLISPFWLTRPNKREVSLLLGDDPAISCHLENMALPFLRGVHCTIDRYPDFLSERKLYLSESLAELVTWRASRGLSCIFAILKASTMSKDQIREMLIKEKVLIEGCEEVILKSEALPSIEAEHGIIGFRPDKLLFKVGALPFRRLNIDNMVGDSNRKISLKLVSDIGFELKLYATIWKVKDAIQSIKDHPSLWGEPTSISFEIDRNFNSRRNYSFY